MTNLLSAFRLASLPAGAGDFRAEVKAFLKANKYGRLINAAPTVTAAAEAPMETPKPAADPKAEAAKKEKDAKAKLELANDFKSNTAKYRERLQAIVKDYPDTQAAAEAQKILATLK